MKYEIKSVGPVTVQVPAGGTVVIPAGGTVACDTSEPMQSPTCRREAMKTLQGPLSIGVFADQRITFRIDQYERRLGEACCLAPIPRRRKGDERRTATKQRRARGRTNSNFNSLFRYKDDCIGPLYGRRANDATDHKERRDKLTTEFWYGGTRKYDRVERRTNHSSPNPRIRALERRKS